MRVFLIHVRDPQFYALPAATRAANGNVRVMGFPPIGIMSLSAVLKRGRSRMRDVRPGQSGDAERGDHRGDPPPAPRAVGLSFLSTTSYPYAKILARQIRAADATVRIAFGGVFATLNAPLVKLQCPEVDFVCRGDGEQLILDLVDRLDDPASVAAVTWARDGEVVQNPERGRSSATSISGRSPTARACRSTSSSRCRSTCPAVLSMERFTTMQTSRGCPWPCVFCDIPIFNEGKWRSRSPQHVVAEFEHLQKLGYGSVYFVDDHFLLQPKRIEAICTRHRRRRRDDPVGLRGPRRLGRAASLPRDGEGALPDDHVRHRERQPAACSTA